MMPRLTARSRIRIASSTVSFACGVFSVTAARAVFTDERIVLRTARLRRRRVRVCLIRFLAGGEGARGAAAAEADRETEEWPRHGAGGEGEKRRRGGGGGGAAGGGGEGP